MTTLFEYDSRRTATKSINPPCEWVRVVETRREIPVKSAGVGDTGHVIMGHSEVHGQIAARESPGAVFHLTVIPEDGVAFVVRDCTLVGDRHGHVREFVGRTILYTSASAICHVDRPRCRLCGGEDFVEANANGDYFCGDCQSVHQIRTITVEGAKSEVVGQITSFEPTGKRPPRVYEMSSGIRDYIPGRLRVPEDFKDYSECNCDQALMYLAMIKALATTASGELRQLALATVERWERNYPGVDLTARLKTLEEDK